MIVVPRPLYRVLVLAGLVATTFVAGCGGKKNVPTSTPPAATPAPAPAQPTVTLSADPTSINKGDSSTLNWTSTNATQLTISPEVGTVTAEGSTKVTPSDSTTYTVTASGPGGSATATARVTVSTPAPAPAPAAEPNWTELFTREVQDA